MDAGLGSSQPGLLNINDPSYIMEGFKVILKSLSQFPSCPSPLTLLKCLIAFLFKCIKIS